MEIKKKEKKDTGVLYARIPKDLLAWVKKKAHDSGYSLTEYMTEVIKQLKK